MILLSCIQHRQWALSPSCFFPRAPAPVPVPPDPDSVALSAPASTLLDSSLLSLEDGLFDVSPDFDVQIAGESFTCLHPARPGAPLNWRSHHAPGQSCNSCFLPPLPHHQLITNCTINLTQPSSALRGLWGLLLSNLLTPSSQKLVKLSWIQFPTIPLPAQPLQALGLFHITQLKRLLTSLHYLFIYFGCMWYLSSRTRDQIWALMPPELEGRVLTTGPEGKFSHLPTEIPNPIRPQSPVYATPPPGGPSWLTDPLELFYTFYHFYSTSHLVLQVVIVLHFHGPPDRSQTLWAGTLFGVHLCIRQFT